MHNLLDQAWRAADGGPEPRSAHDDPRGAGGAEQEKAQGGQGEVRSLCILALYNCHYDCTPLCIARAPVLGCGYTDTFELCMLWQPG